jgi:hypothetical protein
VTSGPASYEPVFGSPAEDQVVRKERFLREHRSCQIECNQSGNHWTAFLAGRRFDAKSLQGLLNQLEAEFS